MAQRAAFWAPKNFAARRPRLKARARIVKALRDWFDREGFVEIEPSALQVSPGNETHIAGFATRFEPLGVPHATYYLHSSPEFDCKKLLAAGETKDFFARPCLPQRRAHAAAPSRVHHAGMVPRRGALSRPDRRLRRRASRRGGGGGGARIRLWRVAARSARRARSPLRGRSIRSLRGRRSARIARKSRRFGAGSRPARGPGRRRRSLVGPVQQDSLRKNRAQARPWPRDGAGRLSGERGRARPAQARGSALRRAFRALRLRGGTGQRLRRTDRPKRAAPPFRGRYGGTGADLRLVLPDRRGFPRSPRRHAAGLRLRSGIDRLVMLATGASHIEDVLWAPVAAP